MSIKDLFDKGYSLKFLKNKALTDLREDLESPRYIDAYSKKRNRFIPDVDFTTASNFARFGSAELYYESSIKRIYETYPYDGSLAEKIEWENNSTYLDLFIFEHEYPRTNGYISVGQGTSFVGEKAQNLPIFSSSLPQFVLIKGGPNADPNGNYKYEKEAGPSKIGTSKANIYHTGSQRTNNLEFDLAKGATIEFWLKKTDWAPQLTEDGTAYDLQEYVFHLHNTGSHSGTGTSPCYGDFRVILSRSKKDRITINARSGSTAIAFTHDIGPISDIADSKWHHYAITLKDTTTTTISNLYFDGVHNSKKTANAGPLTAFSGTMVAALGACVAPISGSSTESRPSGDLGFGQLVSASFDEFRYWKTERDAQQIGRYFKAQLGGGTNTDNVKYDHILNYVDLGVYYKFNEGIVGIDSTDSIVLDYSGRISNGNFVGYNENSRATGSAMVLAGVANEEFKDPILYSNHSQVSSLITNRKNEGSAHDHENSVSLYRSMPGWIAEEDEQKTSQLKYLTQIIASFFDDLYLQIQKLPRLKDINYPFDNEYEKPLPFADRLLTTRGYDAPELFAHASALAKYLERDEKKLFEKKLHEVKNTIYQNIYNNLSYIQKSKGTYKSLRNFLRCFGVDEELVKLNIYANNDVYEFKNNFTNTAVRKKYLDFDDLETRLTASGVYTDSFTATAYQYYDASDGNSISYIPAISALAASGSSMTLEAEVIFPKRFISSDKNYHLFPTNVASLFGMHAVRASNTDLTFADDDTINFNITAQKNDNDKRNVTFALTTSGSSPILSDLSTGSFMSVYDNEKWNLAFRLKPTKYPFASLVSGSLSGSTAAYDESYTYELYGVNYVSNVLQNEFSISGTISYGQAEKFFTQPKRIFAGAARTNFTGSVEKYSDVKVSSVRFWFDYLSDETIRAHAKNAHSYGRLHPYKNTSFAASHKQLFDTYIPEIDTLMLNWTLDNVTGSNSSGQFLIHDYTSGSLRDKTISRYGWLSDISEYNYAGRGDFFVSDVAHRDQAVDVEFVQTAKQKLPEIVNSDDMVKLLNKQDDVVFTRDTTYVQHILSVEKSMYQIISEEMLRFFATVVDFNNLVGDPVNRYRRRYKRVDKLKQLFFERVENEPDLEKFTEYFKWVYDAVTMMIYQLIPVSSNTVELLRNMVEGHILERNKYWSKFPTLELDPPVLVGSVHAIEELKYNWKFGHAPVSAAEVASGPGTQNESCLWWNERAERDGPKRTNNSDVNSDRNSLLKIFVTELTGSTGQGGPPTLKTIGGTKYIKSYYSYRSLGRITDLVTDKSLKLKAGSNPHSAQRHDFYKGAIKFGSDDDFIYLDLDNEIKQVDCSDQPVPDEVNRKEFRFNALTMEASELNSIGTGSTNHDFEYVDAKSSLLLPFNIFSSSIDSGYASRYSDQYKLDFTNMHEDKYGVDAEIPMQGPFTERHVGGMQHRHVGLNLGSDNQITRPEGWFLEFFLNLDETEYVLTERFLDAPSGGGGTTDTKVLVPALAGNPLSIDDPSEYEYWTNGVPSAPNKWKFVDGGTSTADTGPSSGNYAYCDASDLIGSPDDFGLVSPLIDLLDVQSDEEIRLSFGYHMHGEDCGTLAVQGSSTRDFSTDVVNIPITWDHDGASPLLSTSISGEQHAFSGLPFKNAIASSKAFGSGLQKFVGKRFFIRFVYSRAIGIKGDVAIDNINIYKYDGVKQNSFKLLNPTFDDHRKPSATRTRGGLAKRPVNIKNIETTGSVSGTMTVGNYFNKYEYVNTVSPEANDPWFVKNVDSIVKTSALTLNLTGSSITSRLLNLPTGSGPEKFSDLVPSGESTGSLPDRTYLTGSVRNRTRFKSRFSAPGGFEVMTRGFLDPAHEIYSAYNAMPWRNRWVRQVHNSQLQAHMGQFGASTHTSASARVYGYEGLGTIRDDDYLIVSASAHRYHRNNIERIEFVGDSLDRKDDPSGGANLAGGFITASFFDNGFVSHMIPRTDNQTRWITASII